MSNREEKCREIITASALEAGATGFGLGGVIGSKVADIGITTAIQIKMIIQLGNVYGKNITRSGAQGLITSYLAQTAGRTAVGLLSSKIPVAGKFINASVGAAATEGLGWFTVETFED